MNPKRLVIRSAAVEEVIDLRWRILRAGLDRSTAFFEGDHESTTHHLVAELNGRVVGCVTILQRPWEGQPAWQMRGMAIEPELQGTGIGRMLVDAVERTAREAGHSCQLWCNARSPVVGFYHKLGWKVVGEEFVIPTAGPHFRMQKRLQDS
jgi:N-acetylglutamate synthase-like GNAT family acetyltransferase